MNIPSFACGFIQLGRPQHKGLVNLFLNLLNSKRSFHSLESNEEFVSKATNLVWNQATSIILLIDAKNSVQPIHICSCSLSCGSVMVHKIKLIFVL